jgi:hypothetical protein
MFTEHYGCNIIETQYFGLFTGCTSFETHDAHLFVCLDSLTLQACPYVNAEQGK